MEYGLQAFPALYCNEYSSSGLAGAKVNDLWLGRAGTVHISWRRNDGDAAAMGPVAVTHGEN